jgi:hypothetical protein
MKSTSLTFEEAIELIDYHPRTGRFFWKERTEKWFVDGYHSAKGQANKFNLKFAGKETFLNSNTTGYRQARVNGSMVCAHCLAWLIMTGAFNSTDIDHIDGNKKNNKWSNLRLVNRSENCRNKSKRSDNSSGVTGISLKKSSGKWQAYIYHDRHIHLGYYDSLEDAILVRKRAEKEYGYHENHGRD